MGTFQNKPIGEVVKFKIVESTDEKGCCDCVFSDDDCSMIACGRGERTDGKDVIFEKIEE